MTNFIQNLEVEASKLNITFEQFDNMLWLYLCKQQKQKLKELTTELEAKGKYLSDTNIGNIRLEIIDKLQINFML